MWTQWWKQSQEMILSSRTLTFHWGSSWGLQTFSCLGTNTDSMTSRQEVEFSKLWPRLKKKSTRKNWARSSSTGLIFLQGSMTCLTTMEKWSWNFSTRTLMQPMVWLWSKFSWHPSTRSMKTIAKNCRIRFSTMSKRMDLSLSELKSLKWKVSTSTSSEQSTCLMNTPSEKLCSWRTKLKRLPHKSKHNLKMETMMMMIKSRRRMWRVQANMLSTKICNLKILVRISVVELLQEVALQRLILSSSFWKSKKRSRLKCSMTLMEASYH